VVTGTEPGQAAPAAMSVFCSAATQTPIPAPGGVILRPIGARMQPALNAYYFARRHAPRSAGLGPISMPPQSPRGDCLMASDVITPKVD
jgi:hypothetical protein